MSNKHYLYYVSDLVKCEPRVLDMRYIYSVFRQKNYKITKKAEKADIILIYTCAFDKPHEKHAIKKIKEMTLLKKKNARIIVGGCLPGINKVLLRKYFKGDIFVTRELEKINDLIPSPGKVDSVDSFRAEDDPFVKNVINIRVQTGCLGTCTYCAIRYAIGKAKSRAPKEILEEARVLMSKYPNVKTVGFIGDNLGFYGVDINTNLVGLLSFLDKYLPNDIKFCLDRMHPLYFKRMLFGLKKYIESKRITLIYIPFQSASNRILKKMDRFYTNEDIKKIIAETKRWNKNLKIVVDIMVGFPSETTDDFQETALFLKEYGSNFTTVNVFSYDKRPNTSAARMQKQVSTVEKNRRFKVIQKILLAHKKAEYYADKMRPSLKTRQHSASFIPRNLNPDKIKAFS